jgi:hypothetical protein
LPIQAWSQIIEADEWRPTWDDLTEPARDLFLLLSVQQLLLLFLQHFLGLEL